MLSKSEKDVLRTFRQFLMTPNRMLCFFGPELTKKKAALQSLIDKDLLDEDTFHGGYSLTRKGFDMMNQFAEGGSKQPVT